MAATAPITCGPAGRCRSSSRGGCGDILSDVLDHLSIQCADFEAGAVFCDRVLAPLGGGRRAEFGNVIGYGTSDHPELWIGVQTTGDGFRESHIAFQAPDRTAVGRFFEAAEAGGADVLHGPTLWPEYGADYDAAFVRDPDGNNVEATCRTQS